MPKSKPKSKKQKTHHHHQQTNNTTDTLSHEQIWDDSALVRSWNDALAEYEYYHSIHARGEDVDEVLRQAERDEGGRRGEDVDDTMCDVIGEHMMEMSADEGEVDDDDDDDDVVGVARGPGGLGDGADAGHDAARVLGPQLPPLKATYTGTTITDADAALAPGLGLASVSVLAHTQPQPQPSTSTPPSAPTTAAAAATAPSTAPPPSPTQTQTLENLKMAYYWAGYYSGLHDGQQKT